MVESRLTWLGASIPTPKALSWEFTSRWNSPDVVTIRSAPAMVSTARLAAMYPTPLEGRSM